MIPQSNEVRFEITTNCNYNCVICPREQLTRKIETMSLDKFRELFDKVISRTSQYDTLTFSGFGEPLIDLSLDEKISYVRRRGLEVLILSNGSLLTVPRFKKLEELGVKSIRISLYGTSPQTYSAIHGVSNQNLYSKVMRNLMEITRIKKRTQILMTYNVVQNINQAEMEEWIKLWEKRVDLVEVWRPHNWVNVKIYREVQEQKLKTCGRPWKTPLQVQVDGTVNMCCFDFNGKLLLGDLNKQSLKEIFSAAPFKKILYCHEMGDFAGSGLICENCDQRNANKTDVMIYNSKFDIKERVGKVSTTYTKLSS